MALVKVMFPGVQQGDTHAQTDANTNYAVAAIYRLAFKPTSNVVNLVVANDTFVDSPTGMALRTVELALVSVDQPSCHTGVSLPPQALWVSDTSQFLS